MAAASVFYPQWGQQNGHWLHSPHAALPHRAAASVPGQIPRCCRESQSDGKRISETTPIYYLDLSLSGQAAFGLVYCMVDGGVWWSWGGKGHELVGRDGMVGEGKGEKVSGMLMADMGGSRVADAL